MKYINNLFMASCLFALVFQLKSSTAEPSTTETPKPQSFVPTAAPPSDGPAKRCPLEKELYEAAWIGNLAEVERLLDYGVDPNYANADGNTSLTQSTRYGHAVIVQLLLQRGANVNSSASDGWTALHAAAENDRSGRLVVLLAENGAHLNSMTTSQDTPLHRAAMKDNVLAARILVDRGASMRLANKLGETPHDLAVSEAFRSLV